MKIIGKEFCNLKVSKELLKQISHITDESYDDIKFNLLTTLNNRITHNNINAYGKKRKVFGLHRVIEYPGTKIKAKCKVVFISENIFTHVSDKDTGTNITIAPQTGQWVRMEKEDINQFLQKKSFEVIDGVLLGAETSSEAPFAQQSPQDHTVPSE